eukprot:Lithocolla_globosa_v1_NODE_2888_length_1834_cov_7.356942.p2 type:complete len:160 gc:universal NODE_2888_length_1834_cov_7.356942:1181-1660(+)
MCDPSSLFCSYIFTWAIWLVLGIFLSFCPNGESWLVSAFGCDMLFIVFLIIGGILALSLLCLTYFVERNLAKLLFFSTFCTLVSSALWIFSSAEIISDPFRWVGMVLTIISGLALLTTTFYVFFEDQSKHSQGRKLFLLQHPDQNSYSRYEPEPRSENV